MRIKIKIKETKNRKIVQKIIKIKNCYWEDKQNIQTIRLMRERERQRNKSN